MNDPTNEQRPLRTQIEDLLAQDEVVSSFPYQEFRMQLEASIKRLEARARAVHRAALGSQGLVIVCVALFPFAVHPDRLWMAWVVGACGIAALAVTFVLSGLDFYKYRPVLKKKRRELMWAAIDQLQHDVAELKSMLQEKS